MHQLAWILAASQALPLLFAILAFFLTLIAAAAIVGLLAVVLFMLLLDRRP